MTREALLGGPSTQQAGSWPLLSSLWEEQVGNSNWPSSMSPAVVFPVHGPSSSLLELPLMLTYRWLRAVLLVKLEGSLDVS